MKWMCALLLCVLCVGCDDAFKSLGEKPGTDTWIIGTWNFKVIEGNGRIDDDPVTGEFWANHSHRLIEHEGSGRQDIDDAAWKIVGNNLVVLPIRGDSEAGPDMEEVKEALAEYEVNPEKVGRKSVYKMEDLAQDSVTLIIDDGPGGTWKIKATRIKS